MVKVIDTTKGDPKPLNPNIPLFEHTDFGAQQMLEDGLRLAPEESPPRNNFLKNKRHW